METEKALVAALTGVVPRAVIALVSGSMCKSFGRVGAAAACREGGDGDLRTVLPSPRGEPSRVRWAPQGCGGRGRGDIAAPGPRSTPAGAAGPGSARCRARPSPAAPPLPAGPGRAGGCGSGRLRPAAAGTGGGFLRSGAAGGSSMERVPRLVAAAGERREPPTGPGPRTAGGREGLRGAAGGRHRAASASLGRARRPRGVRLGAAGGGGPGATACGGRGSGPPAAPGAPRLRPRTGGRGPVFPGRCASPPGAGAVSSCASPCQRRGVSEGRRAARFRPLRGAALRPVRAVLAGPRGSGPAAAPRGSGCAPRAETKAAGSSRALSDARAFPFAGNDSRGTKGPTPAAAPRELRAKRGKRFTLRAALPGSAPRCSAGEGRLRARTCGAFWRRLGLVRVCGRRLRGREAALRDGRNPARRSGVPGAEPGAAPSPRAGLCGGRCAELRARR